MGFIQAESGKFHRIPETMTVSEWDFSELQALGTLAAFNPTTCIIRAERLSRAAEEARLASGQLCADIEKNTGYFHELFHWVQFQASTVGQFLTTIRHARDQLVFQSVLHDVAFRRVLFDLTETSALISYDRMIEADSRFSPATGQRLNECRDLEVIRRLFYRPETVAHENYGLTAAMEKSIGCVLLLEQERQSANPAWNVSSQPTCTVTSSDVVNIETTTESILELSAIAMELLLHLTAGTIEENLVAYIVDRCKQAIRENRQSALRFVADTVMKEIDNACETGDGTPLHDTLAKIATLCDIALNPPLPPAVPPSATLHLDDLLPASRFTRLLAVTDQADSGDVFELSCEAVVSYRDRITKAANLQYGTPAECRLPAPYPATPHTTALPRYHWLLLRASSERFFNLRAEFPELLVFFGAIFSGYRSEAFADAVERVGKNWFLPPIAERPDGLHPWIEAPAATAFLQSVATDILMNKLVTREQAPRFGCFPESCRHDLMQMTSGWIERLCNALN